MAAPINAAAAAGMPVKSTSSRRRVLAIQPIRAAIAAIGTELLNIIENPNTPQKLAINRRTSRETSLRFNIFPICNVVNSSGCKCSNKAIIHANTVATSTIIIEYVSLSIPDRRSSFARSMPLVMKGNPGIMKSMEHMYPASCTKGILNIRIASLSRIAYIRHDADIETAIFMNSVK